MARSGEERSDELKVVFQEIKAVYGCAEGKAMYCYPSRRAKGLFFKRERRCPTVASLQLLLALPHLDRILLCNEGGRRDGGCDGVVGLDLVDPYLGVGVGGNKALEVGNERGVGKGGDFGRGEVRGEFGVGDLFGVDVKLGGLVGDGGVRDSYGAALDVRA